MERPNGQGKRLDSYSLTAAAAKSLQSCPTLCNPIDGSPSGSPVPGILQARTLEWVAISFSNAGKWKVKVKLLSPVWLLATPWTAAYQASPSMGFSRQSTGVGCHCLLCIPWQAYAFMSFSVSVSLCVCVCVCVCVCYDKWLETALFLLR